MILLLVVSFVVIGCLEEFCFFPQFGFAHRYALVEMIFRFQIQFIIFVGSDFVGRLGGTSFFLLEACP